MCIALEGGEVEAQMRLRDQAIYRLKQEIASLREEKESTIFTLEERNKELISEVQELKHRLSLALIKEEGTANGKVCMAFNFSLTFINS